LFDIKEEAEEEKSVNVNGANRNLIPTHLKTVVII